MKWATCEKSGIAKSPSNFLRLVGRRKVRGGVFRESGVMWRDVGWDRSKCPDEPKPVFILPVRESEADGDEGREACREFQAHHSPAVLNQRPFQNPNP
jgi:hypothetical protein